MKAVTWPAARGSANIRLRSTALCPNNMQRRRRSAMSPSPRGVYFSLSAAVSLPEPTLSLGSYIQCTIVHKKQKTTPPNRSVGFCFVFG